MVAIVKEQNRSSRWNLDDHIAASISNEAIKSSHVFAGLDSGPESALRTELVAGNILH